ncbi:hypothetical protein FRB99_006431 [Tulasnella sp. 403]|nr:hypothetical protein FRB99_006431 [Tulasnella sp. 403]
MRNNTAILFFVLAPSALAAPLSSFPSGHSRRNLDFLAKLFRSGDSQLPTLMSKEATPIVGAVADIIKKGDLKGGVPVSLQAQIERFALHTPADMKLSDEAALVMKEFQEANKGKSGFLKTVGTGAKAKAVGPQVFDEFWTKASPAQKLLTFGAAAVGGGLLIKSILGLGSGDSVPANDASALGGTTPAFTPEQEQQIVAVIKATKDPQALAQILGQVIPSNPSQDEINMFLDAADPAILEQAVNLYSQGQPATAKAYSSRSRDFWQTITRFFTKSPSTENAVAKFTDGTVSKMLSELSEKETPEVINSLKSWYIKVDPKEFKGNAEAQKAYDTLRGKIANAESGPWKIGAGDTAKAVASMAKAEFKSLSPFAKLTFVAGSAIGTGLVLRKALGIGQSDSIPTSNSGDGAFSPEQEQQIVGYLQSNPDQCVGMMADLKQQQQDGLNLSNTEVQMFLSACPAAVDAAQQTYNPQPAKRSLADLD